MRGQTPPLGEQAKAKIQQTLARVGTVLPMVGVVRYGAFCREKRRKHNFICLSVSFPSRHQQGNSRQLVQEGDVQ